MDALKTSPSEAVAGPLQREQLRGWLEMVLQTSAVVRAWRQQLAGEVAEQQLTDQEFLVLWLCDSKASSQCGQGELAEAVGASPAQMSGLVERLRRRDLLRFERSEHDRRRQFWQLTEAGQQLLAQLCQTMIEGRDRVHSQVGVDEQRRLLQLLHRWSPGQEEQASEDQPTEALLLHTPDLGGPSSCAA